MMKESIGPNSFTDMTLALRQMLAGIARPNRTILNLAISSCITRFSHGKVVHLYSTLLRQTDLGCAECCRKKFRGPTPSIKARFADIGMIQKNEKAMRKS